MSTRWRLAFKLYLQSCLHWLRQKSALTGRKTAALLCQQWQKTSRVWRYSPTLSSSRLTRLSQFAFSWLIFSPPFPPPLSCVRGARGRCGAPMLLTQSTLQTFIFNYCWVRAERWIINRKPGLFLASGSLTLSTGSPSMMKPLRNRKCIFATSV